MKNLLIGVSLLCFSSITSLEKEMNKLSLKNEKKEKQNSDNKAIMKSVRIMLSDIIKKSKNKEQQEKIIGKRKLVRVKEYSRERHKRRDEKFAQLRNNYVENFSDREILEARQKELSQSDSSLPSDLIELQIINIVLNQELRTMGMIQRLKDALKENKEEFDKEKAEDLLALLGSLEIELDE